jgi:hypothetical protein
VALVTGCAITVIGLGAYEAWWTIAFAVAGLVVAIQTQQQTPASLSLAIGLLVGGAVLSAGMSLFLLFGSGRGGAPWLAASIATAVLAVAFLVVARRLRTSRSDRLTLPGAD